ncbi:AraC family transcriptional regulator [Novosphingobium sp.]|uniref:helix-turn-helix domain-containing protein n=1 Tax=Novosphingobium sp. TaxID=1874826 RepID=UPI002736F566|nr:helix-turn-helix domain-containing protein [Novosphingobium sp.]MDP3905851.1 helix-turn-helix domain-containing protein [Novosphingobium sp.]
MMKQVIGDAITVRFFMPSPELAPYFTTFYLTEVKVSETDEVEDWLHPEWANIRFAQNPNMRAAVGDEPLRAAPRMIATGPTSLAGHFVSGPFRTWGIGIQPLGWSRFCNGPAADLVDRFCDGTDCAAFAAFAPLLDEIYAGIPDPAGEAARIDAFLLALLKQRPPADDEARIHTAHTALVDQEVGSVSELAGRLGMSSRSLERLSLRAFGFSPKLLLRRQRFLRSLAQFMLDPSLTWISTLDWQYVDQAHFVRDFKRFMGMSPSRYAALDHPVLRAAARARAAAAGAAVQALHRP